MELKVLFIEDDEVLCQSLKENFHNEIISGYQINAKAVNTFEEGISDILTSDFDIVVLDLFKDKVVKDEEAGIKVLNEIRKNAFLPVIFYTAHAYKITDLKSEIVGIVSKGDGIEALIKEIERIINSKIALLKKNVNAFMKEEFRKYFWDTVDDEKKLFVPEQSDFSIGYLVLRRLASSLSKENIKNLLGDNKININKIHPMEFYIYPPNCREYEAGDILIKDNIHYAILTPSCDFITEGSRSRKVGKVLLAIATPLKQTEQFIKYQSNPDKFKQSLIELIESRKGDRYFFLPGTAFIENLILDFQNKTMVSYEDLSSYKKIAKLDDPFAQSMISGFIRYYNRIGFPDIDSDYIISNLPPAS